MTDHAAEAQQHIDWAHEQQEREGDMGNVPRDDALLAQAHATLALVEQQRIANIIAFTTGSGYDMSTDVAERIARDLGTWGGETETGKPQPIPVEEEPDEFCMICHRMGPAQFECPHLDAHLPLANSRNDANGEPWDDDEEAAA